jgi:hypothetical protein
MKLICFYQTLTKLLSKPEPYQCLEILNSSQTNRISELLGRDPVPIKDRQYLFPIRDFILHDLLLSAPFKTLYRNYGV